MSKNNISISFNFLKDLDEKINNLARVVDQLEILTFSFKKPSSTTNHLDILIYNLRQSYEDLKKLNKIK